jgi:hypothetical protein
MWARSRLVIRMHLFLVAQTLTGPPCTRWFSSTVIKKSEFLLSAQQTIPIKMDAEQLEWIKVVSDFMTLILIVIVIETLIMTVINFNSSCFMVGIRWRLFEKYANKLRRDRINYFYDQC